MPLLTTFQNKLLEAGCDEAGRGCLAGPVVAAAVILPKGYTHLTLNDSKQLSETQRIAIRADIERDALAYAIAVVSPQEIDEINILQASIRAMHRACDQLAIRPELLLIDGNRFVPYQNIPHACMIKGDARFLHIAAASVLAKTYRDELMKHLHLEFPAYKWSSNKGYPTLQHRAAIRAYGITIHHRRTFRLLPEKTLFEP